LTTAAVTARATTASTATAFTGGTFAFANTLHHVRARCFGCSLHHITAGWTACTAPQSLTTHCNRLRPLAWFRSKAFQNLDWNFLFGEALDFHHETFFIQAHQADGFSAGTGTTGPANAVHIIFRYIGNLVIDNVWQVFNVNAAGCNVGGDQDANVAAFETC
jgi:hypothetical protein